MPLPIEDYALIGDCQTAALVGRDGSIDWLCWPRFDSDACFAALLGTPEHGRWLIVPQAPDVKVTRRYREDTLILETRFETATGSVCVIDFMPPRDHASDLVRIVVGERGEVAMHTELVLRFGYGNSVPWVTHIAEDTWRAIAGPDMVVLRTPAPMHGENLKSVRTSSSRKASRFRSCCATRPRICRTSRSQTLSTHSLELSASGGSGSRKGTASTSGRMQ